jgi:menaquinone-dependent protoporphyrinogen oxidase
VAYAAHQQGVRIMRVLVVYASHYGATKGIAERITEKLRQHELDVDLRSADHDFVFAADGTYDGFVIGSAIHAGHWLKPATEFVHGNAAVLATRPAWLFSSGPIGDKYVDEPQPDPKEIDDFRKVLDLRDHIVFAGAFDPQKVDWSDIGWLERQISQRFIPVGDFRDWDVIESWADAIARTLSPVLVA